MRSVACDVTGGVLSVAMQRRGQYWGFLSVAGDVEKVKVSLMRLRIDEDCVKRAHNL